MIHSSPLFSSSGDTSEIVRSQSPPSRGMVVHPPTHRPSPGSWVWGPVKDNERVDSATMYTSSSSTRLIIDRLQFNKFAVKRAKADKVGSSEETTSGPTSAF